MSQPWTPPPGPWGPPGASGPGGSFPAYGGPAWTPAPAVPASLRGLAIALTALLGLAMLGAGFATVALFDLAGVIDDGGRLRAVVDAENRAFGLLGLLVLVGIAILSVWIVWQYRHARNAELLGRRDGLGPAWAIAGWFVPGGSLVLPPLQLLQSGRASDEPGRSAAGTIVVVVAWWVVFVTALAMVFAGIFIATPDEFGRVATEDEVTGYRLAGAGLVAAVVAAAAGATVVRVVTDRQGDAIDRGLPPPVAMAPPGSAFGPPPPPRWGAPPGPGWHPPPAGPGWGPPPPPPPPPPADRVPTPPSDVPPPPGDRATVPPSPSGPLPSAAMTGARASRR